MKPVTCYLLTQGGNWQQETYETASRDAGRRARQLRGLGYRVSVSPLGQQITQVGCIRLTLLTVRDADAALIPPPDKIISI